jgi:arabinoxylan arabinofuranohydrolase
MNSSKILVVLICTFLIHYTPASQVFAENPIISHTYTADPSAMEYNGRIYVIMSNDEDNNNGYQIYKYTLISSDDMVNWTDHGEVFKVKDVSKWASMCYAPSCVVREGKCYLYYPDGGSGIGVAVADRPEGPYKEPLGKALINKNMPNCNVPWLFDPCGFVDEDGQAYLAFGGGDSGAGTNLRIIKLNADMTSTSGTAVTVNAPASFEAAYLHKYNKKYYFSYSTTSQKIDYLMGDKPMSDFTFKGTVLPNPPKDLGNNNHSSIVQFKDKWYIFYHDRSISNAVYKRSVCVDVITYNADGSMKQTTCTTAGPAQIKSLNPYDTVQAETIGKQKGIETDVCSEGGMMVTSIANGDWIKYFGVDFGTNADKFEARVAGATGGSIELHLESETGALAGTCEVASTGGLTTWKTVSCDVTGASGVKNLYLVFKGTGEPFRFNWFRFSTTTGVQRRIGLNEPPASNRAISHLFVKHGISTGKNMRILYDLAGKCLPGSVGNRSVHFLPANGIFITRKEIKINRY